MGQVQRCAEDAVDSDARAEGRAEFLLGFEDDLDGLKGVEVGLPNADGVRCIEKVNFLIESAGEGVGRSEIADFIGVVAGLFDKLAPPSDEGIFSWFDLPPCTAEDCLSNRVAVFADEDESPLGVAGDDCSRVAEEAERGVGDEFTRWVFEDILLHFKEVEALEGLARFCLMLQGSSSSSPMQR